MCAFHPHIYVCLYNIILYHRFNICTGERREMYIPDQFYMPMAEINARNRHHECWFYGELFQQGILICKSLLRIRIWILLGYYCFYEGKKSLFVDNSYIYFENWTLKNTNYGLIDFWKTIIQWNTVKPQLWNTWK